MSEEELDRIVESSGEVTILGAGLMIHAEYLSFLPKSLAYQGAIDRGRVTFRAKDVERVIAPDNPAAVHYGAHTICLHGWADEEEEGA